MTFCYRKGMYWGNRGGVSLGKNVKQHAEDSHKTRANPEAKYTCHRTRRIWNAMFISLKIFLVYHLLQKCPCCVTMCFSVFFHKRSSCCTCLLVHYIYNSSSVECRRLEASQQPAGVHLARSIYYTNLSQSFPTNFGRKPFTLIDIHCPHGTIAILVCMQWD